jgi:NADPH2:quinone reductase
VRALVFDGPAADAGTSRVAELPEPSPGPGQLTIDVLHAGINFKDIMARRGDTGYVDAWPFVPGLEVSGIVRALGPGVEDLRIGDPVVALTGSGGLAEIALAEAHLTVPVPPRVRLDQAAAAPGALATALLLLTDLGRIQRGETVLLHGAAGGVGQAVARLARVLGASKVLGTVGSVGRAEVAQRLGYDAVFLRDDSLQPAINAASEGRGVDLILDPQGTTLVELDLRLVAPGGRIVLFGNATGARLAPLPALERLLAGNVAIAGFSLAALARIDPTRVAAALAEVLSRLATGTVGYELTTVTGLTAVPQAHQAIAEGRIVAKQVVQVAGAPEADTGLERAVPAARRCARPMAAGPHGPC